MKEFDSKCADMKNSVAGRANAQCSCAGHFIESHLKDGHNFDQTWLHVDMASPSQSNRMTGAKHMGTGYGVALLPKLFSEHFTKNQKLFC